MEKKSISTINSRPQGYFDYLFDFYHLDFWKDKSLAQGYQIALDEFADVALDCFQEKSNWIKASAGAGLGLASLFGTIPLAINDWAVKVAKEIPRGPGWTLYRFLEVPIGGIFQSGAHVYLSASQWLHGSLNDQDSFAIAKEITGVLGTAAFLVFGARFIGKGGGKIVKGFTSDLPSLQANGLATATAGIDGALIMQGGGNILAGTIYSLAGIGDGETEGAGLPAAGPPAAGPPSSAKSSSGRKSRVDDQQLAEVLEQCGGNRSQAARELGILADSVNKRVRNASATSPLKKFQAFKTQNRPRVDDAVLAQALERHGGDRTKAVREVGLEISGVYHRIKKADPNSPLHRFQRMKGKGGIAPRFDDNALAEVLRRHQGSRAKAAKAVGLSPTTVSKRLKRAKSGSPLEPFKEPRSNVRVDEATLARALEKHQGNRRRTAREVGLHSSAVRERIKRAKEGSPLFSFREIRGKGGLPPRAAPVPKPKPPQKRTVTPKKMTGPPQRRDFIALRLKAAPAAPDVAPLARMAKNRIPDLTMAETLRKHNGNSQAVARELGITPDLIASRLQMLKEHPDWAQNSPLKDFIFLVGE